MKHFYMITNPFKDKGLETTKRINDYLKKAGAGCTIQTEKDTQKGSYFYTNADNIPEDTDCILVLGGDGTLIEAARDTVKKDIPLIGINMGSLGFLAEVEQSGIENALEMLMRDEYELEKRMMIKGKVLRGDICLEKSYALNDIVITRSGSLHIINFHIYVNGQFLNTYSADGVIVSTPTGSTGYNMSAGGPIVEPKANLMVITPICPHTLNTRSIVLAAEDEVIIEVVPGKEEKKQKVEVNFDGGHTVVLETQDRIKINRSQKSTDIVKLNKVSFLEVLHKKMSEK